MATAGSIVVDLLARTGSFETDIERATKKAKKDFEALSKGIRDSFAGNLLADLAQRLVADLGAVPRAVIDGIDALNDLADATGASIENLSALEDIAERTGTSFDTVGAAVVKFNAALKDATPDSDAERSFRALGLSLQELKRMDPAEALLKTAKALDGFADSGDKARVVQELFGKSVREVAPFLKDLAEKGELVAKVTTEEAKQAEAFNKQLFELQKNIKDFARSVMGDLLPALNAWATVLKEGGILAFLGLGGPDIADPGKRLGEIQDKLTKLRKMANDLDPSKSTTNKINEFIFGDAADVARQIKLLEAEEKALKALDAQQSAAVLAMGPGSTDSKPEINVAGKAGKGKAYATSDKFSEADALAREVEILNEAQEAWRKYEVANTAAISSTYTEADALRMESEILNEAMKLAAEQGKETSKIGEELGLTFASAFEDAVIGGNDLRDVFAGLLKDIAKLILRLEVTEPLLAALKEAMKPDASGSSAVGGFFGDLFKAVAGSFFGGAKAPGGDVIGGREYLVGEHGPEMFVPRTAGAIAPANAAGGTGAISIINQTSGRIDSVATQRVSATERALILQENRAAILGELYDPGSKMSRALGVNFNVRRAR